MGLLEWELGTVGSDLGFRHFKSSSLRLSDICVLSCFRRYWASTEPNTALVRFQHYTCEERGIVVLKCGEKAPYRHRILETGSSILWKVLCPWRACRETLRKHFSTGTIRDWASKSNHAEPIVIIGGGCLELGKLLIIILKSLSFTNSICSFDDIRTFRGASRCFPDELPHASYSNTAPPRCSFYR